MEFGLNWLQPMFKIYEDLMSEQLSDRCHDPAASIGGNHLPRRTVATEHGRRGPVRVCL
jgi:hypothetical protein